MKKWWRRSRDAAGTGLVWAVVWAPIAVLVGMLIDPDNSMDEMWVAVGAYPGFISGVLFSVVIWIAEDRRRFGELPLVRVGAWGALAGLLVGTLPFLLGEPTSAAPLWLLAGSVIGAVTLLSAASAVASALVIRARPAAARSSQST